MTGCEAITDAEKKLRKFKKVYLISILWLIFSAICLLFLSMSNSQRGWLMLISVSGYSTSILFIFISLYLFAIFRGMSRAQYIQIEHPLTTSFPYMLFYVIAPFLGTLAGLAASEKMNLWQFLMMTSMGTIWMTFLVWIVIDPLVTFTELFVPESRKYRKKRLAVLQSERLESEIRKESLLKEAEIKAINQKTQWDNILYPLAVDLVNTFADRNSTEQQFADKGFLAWTTGGIYCMRRLQELTSEIYQEKFGNSFISDFLSACWDGIGNWHDKGVTIHEK